MGQKPNLYKFKKNEITPCAVADYIAIKLKLTGKKKPNSSKYLVMAIKQLITQWWLGQRRNKKKKRKRTVPETKWKRNHNITKPMGHV